MSQVRHSCQLRHTRVSVMSRSQVSKTSERHFEYVSHVTYTSVKSMTSHVCVTDASRMRLEPVTNPSQPSVRVEIKVWSLWNHPPMLILHYRGAASSQINSHAARPASGMGSDLYGFLCSRAFEVTDPTPCAASLAESQTANPSDESLLQCPPVPPALTT